MRNALTTLILLLVSLNISAQKKYQTLDSRDNVSVIYKWKENETEKRMLIVKFKNKSKVHQNINIEIGFYYNGILEEQAQIATCSKKGFFNNLFLTKYGIISQQLDNEQLKNDQFKLALTAFKIEKTSICEKQHE